MYVYMYIYIYIYKLTMRGPLTGGPYKVPMIKSLEERSAAAPSGPGCNLINSPLQT